MTTFGRELRIATLIAAPAVAAIAALPVRSARLLTTTGPVLAALWAIMAVVLAARAQDGRRRDAVDLRAAWHELDVLTATGTATMWTAAGALIASGITGWASLCMLGVLGLGAVMVAATWTAVAAGGDAPWRRATIARAIVPEIASEGDPLREELRLTGVRIPAGMRLFATGRATPSAAITRYAVGAECSRADVRLACALGAATRGEYVAPPLALWLGDVLGLTRTQPIERGEVAFAVLPRPAAVDGARSVLGAGGDDGAAQPTQRLPTEGAFRIRGYLPGDDTRRIHWVRSLQTNRLVVRLADEIPTAEPAVRLILDSEHRGVEALTCRAPDELLDAAVRIWLGVGRALTDAGVRVTLVAAGERGARAMPTGPAQPTVPAGPAVIEHALSARISREVLRLGGRIAWQTALPITALLAPDAAGARQVVVSSRSRRPQVSPRVGWIVVPEASWTSDEAPLLPWALAQLPFPNGCADNRLGRRSRERGRRAMMRSDRTIFRQVMTHTQLAGFAGELVARPVRGRVALEVIP